MTRTRGPDQLDPLALYLDAMGRYPLLTDVDEVELAKAIEAGKAAETTLATAKRRPSGATAEKLQAAIVEGKAAKRRFIQSNLRLVVSIA
ncbi:MAG TPA: sigma-70 factor domain-containing protein, partial [Actinomycetota bacterium]|nr:sigma-70 factor domain-containing protein [Actinomycetota bacterium]